MASSLSSLSNPTYFPSFDSLPLLDEPDTSFYTETSQGLVQPSRTWCFVGEIVNDSLSQMAVLGHRVEVRDATGAVHSIMFYPVQGWLDFRLLRVGHTVFVRYATRCFFSDLATEAIKVEDLNFVHVIPHNLDSLMFISQAFFEQANHCSCCHQSWQARGSFLACKCDACQAATYCSQQCKAADGPAHAGFCHVCAELQQVFNIDFERFTQHVPFRM